MSDPTGRTAPPAALLALAVVGVLGPGAAAVLVARAAGVLQRSLAGGGAPLDPVVGLGACALAALLLGWWVLGVALATWSEIAPSARHVRALSLRLAPPLARRAVATLLGAALAAGAAAPATAEEGGPLRAHRDMAAAPDLRAWSADRPAASGRLADLSTRKGSAAVVVRTGDTLWDIAARTLGPGAGPGSVDRAWRRWYAVNRAVIGPDPDLLHPGLRLHAPDPSTRPR